MHILVDGTAWERVVQPVRDQVIEHLTSTLFRIGGDFLLRHVRLVLPNDWRWDQPVSRRFINEWPLRPNSDKKYIILT
jgi:hypothetical protein